jgi:hypothetical protein
MNGKVSGMNEKVSESDAKRCEAIAEKGRGKYTELELRERGIGKFIGTQ